MFIPALICNAVKNEMDDADKALSVLSAQCALKNLLTNECKPSVDPLTLSSYCLQSITQCVQSRVTGI